jgi:uncharacterized protein
MEDDEFHWDDAKAAENYAKHGVTFEAARDVFKDAFAIDGLDDTEAYGEARYVTIGMAEGRLLYLVYTMRGDAVRIISARAAEPYERRQYHEENR